MVVSSSFLAAAFLLLNLFLGFGPNFGLHFGYYGKLNRVLAVIQEMPDVDVVHVGLHEDATLEDFQIVVIAGGNRRTIYFENANIRTVEDLSTEIAKAL
jgi:hypothetical protein